MGARSEALDVAIVGGGISGLTAALWLSRTGRRVRVFESCATVGGPMQTAQCGDFLFERGPNSLLGPHPALDRLIDACGLRDELVVADESARRRYVVTGAQLREVPTHPMRLLRSGLLSRAGIWRMFAEPLAPAGLPAKDETLAAFMDRRIGREARQILVDAMIGGIYAGSSDTLSARAVFPTLIEAEARYGSIALGLLAKRTPRMGRRVTLSFRQGMGQLPQAIAHTLGADSVWTDAEVTRISDDGEQFHLTIRRGEAHETCTSQRLLVATPAAACARLLAPVLGERVVAPWRAIPYAPIAVVGLGLAKIPAPLHIPPGFGWLAPPAQGVEVLGCLFSSGVFPGRAPTGGAALTAFIGGTRNAQALSLGDEELAAVCAADLERVMGSEISPDTIFVQRWQKGIPQYTPGHLERVLAMRQALHHRPRIEVLGNYLDTLSAPELIANAERLAQNWK